MMCKRVENPTWGTVDFVDTESQNDNVVFRTFPEERKRLVLQLGTGDATRALKCAMLAAKDVSAVDINMGCPLKFSTSSGAGSALLKKPETVRDILTTLRRNLPSDVHVSCKIRLLPTVEETVELARNIEACGVSAFALHGRYVTQKPRDPAHWDIVKQVVASVSCPVIANGDVFEYGDFEKMRAETGAAASMCGRGAMWNQSIFRKEGLLPPRENLRALLTTCCEWENPLKNTKYLMREILIKDKDSGLENPEGRALNKSESLQDVAKLFNLPESLVGAAKKPQTEEAANSSSGVKRPCDDACEEQEEARKRI
jgi:tRNA-dihydrouridine synthase 2